MELQQQLGKAIRAIRTKQGLSQEKLALEAGVDRRYMSDIENGTRNISLNVIDRLSTGLRLSVSQLLKAAEDIESLPLTVKTLKEELCNRGCEETVVLENPDYIDAIIGISADDRLIYSYEKMVAYLVEHENMIAEEAAEFIDYNTIRALSYAGAYAPIVLFNII